MTTTGNNPSRGRASTHLPDRSADLQSPQGFLMPNKQQCRSVDGRWYVARCGVWGSTALIHAIIHHDHDATTDLYSAECPTYLKVDGCAVADMRCHQCNNVRPPTRNELVDRLFPAESCKSTQPVQSISLIVVLLNVSC
jgi:hypothetical protein